MSMPPPALLSSGLLRTLTPRPYALRAPNMAALRRIYSQRGLAPTAAHESFGSNVEGLSFSGENRIKASDQKGSSIEVPNQLPAELAAFHAHAVHGMSSLEPLEGVTEEGKHRAYIALGSNIGDRIGAIERACTEMDRRGIKVVRTSGLWETKPMYVVDQPPFLNGACEVETILKPFELLDELQDIENSLGRVKLVDKGPRNIDLDILLYDDITISEGRLIVPHKLMLEREFVLRPLCELIPEKRLPSSFPQTTLKRQLMALPPSASPISTLTPLSPSLPPIRALFKGRPTLIMAILNLTPDSFSDGGVHNPTSLLDTAISFIQSGASVIDIGGQSTRPNAPIVAEAEEISRILPAIQLLRSHPSTKDVCISIDTFRASVALAAIAAGANIINDISSGTMDLEMLPTVARLGATICLMHSRGTPATMNSLTHYPDGVIPTIAVELLSRVHAAEEAGIRRWRILLDPGLGFAKNQSQNLEILRRLPELREYEGLRGLPWLLGPSRKRFVGRVTGVEEPGKRTWGTAGAVAACVAGGADLVRVHDVNEMWMVGKMADAIWRVDND